MACELGLPGTGVAGRPHPSVRATTFDDLAGLVRQFAAGAVALDTNQTCEGQSVPSP
jgi:hypothetical protein